ncbi:MAG: tRNA-dihydrouridine synthase [Kiritimatiellae bacterium]|nr:tRNA-dihydrouridine synthase [Kiritimatiellia bacterium]
MRFSLAPLAGFTDAPFRRMCREGGADLTYTEMVSAAGLVRGSRPTRRLFSVMPGEGPVAVQLFGASESDLARAAAVVSAAASSAGLSELNLNAGCPVPKVVREGAGARLIEKPDLVFRLLKAMVENSSLPVTLKTRLGSRPGEVRVFELVDAAEKAGAKSVIVHARFTSQMHGGPLRLDILSEVVRRSPLPVAGNGSVGDRASAAAMAATGVASIMIGRAALSDPAIFNRLKAAPGRTVPPPTAADQISSCRRHLDYILLFRDQLAADFPDDRIPSADAAASLKMHTHLFRYFKGMPGAAAIRARLNSIRSIAGIRAAMDDAERSLSNRVFNEQKGTTEL